MFLVHLSVWKWFIFCRLITKERASVLELDRCHKSLSFCVSDCLWVAFYFVVSGKQWHWILTRGMSSRFCVCERDSGRRALRYKKTSKPLSDTVKAGGHMNIQLVLVLPSPYSLLTILEQSWRARTPRLPTTGPQWKNIGQNLQTQLRLSVKMAIETEHRAWSIMASNILMKTSHDPRGAQAHIPISRGLFEFREQSHITHPAETKTPWPLTGYKENRWPKMNVLSHIHPKWVAYHHQHQSDTQHSPPLRSQTSFYFPLHLGFLVILFLPLLAECNYLIIATLDLKINLCLLHLILFPIN